MGAVEGPWAQGPGVGATSYQLGHRAWDKRRVTGSLGVYCRALPLSTFFPGPPGPGTRARSSGEGPRWVGLPGWGDAPGEIGFPRPPPAQLGEVGAEAQQRPVPIQILFPKLDQIWLKSLLCHNTGPSVCSVSLKFWNRS